MSIQTYIDGHDHGNRKANLQAVEKSGLLLGPLIPKKGPVLRFEEIKGIEGKNTYYDLFVMIR